MKILGSLLLKFGGDHGPDLGSIFTRTSEAILIVQLLTC